MVTLREGVGDMLEGGCILWNVTFTKTREQRRKDNYWMYDIPIVISATRRPEGQPGWGRAHVDSDAGGFRNLISVWQSISKLPLIWLEKNYVWRNTFLKDICQDWEAELKATDFRPNAEHFYNISPKSQKPKKKKKKWKVAIATRNFFL